MGRIMYWRCGIVIAFLFFCQFAGAKSADELFKTYQSALVQIKSINIESGQKSSIGTGFFISDTGHMVTNYHVISGFVQRPEKYRLEYIDQEQNNYPVDVLAVDVINDLALLQSQQKVEVNFSLAKEAPNKGEDLFALGNPHDLGMIVVPGTYNGIKKNSFYQRIHFTGSINPGMSGGPTVNQDGQVIGINVATAGNQIGFLVPVERLWTLLDDYQQKDKSIEQDLIADITNQLKNNQDVLYQELLSAQWQTNQLGGAEVPSEVSNFMPCWGDSNKNKEKILYNKASANCSVQERIYLSATMSTGVAQLGFSWLQSNQLTEMQLSKLYQVNLNARSGRSNAGQDDVTDYHCNQAIVENIASSVSKGVTCVRAYRKYPGLFDVNHRSVLLGKDKQSLVSHYFLQGVTQETANNFYQKFVEQVKWK